MSEDAVTIMQVDFHVQGAWSLTELCALTQLDQQALLALVDEGVLEPEGDTLEVWRFSAEQVPAARTAARLLRDLGLNAAGAALALQLMDELEALRAELARLRSD
ncbi:chaperone modulator CbpM [Pseudomarimonas arenosa]|uniref:MerR family transcriptional regulator n=1 Tax=Pseudomarimonas arenosa TaxID=2774145 RepID=A0AAW3ZQ13_9GAMM|nr:chaperone modulator CbpM [Pseudomarimonas arenosa]MBD8526724.1 MerR family transcriptional regulator [Pseudomarimonas arenosa]